MNICFDTFGCRLNRAEALDDQARCLARGDRIVKEHKDADLIVVRGCSVTGRAQRDCEKHIEHLKRKYPMKRVFLTGCITGARPFVVKAPAAGPAVHRPPPKKPEETPTARAYLKVQDGCSGKCTFCIVPKFRGASRSEPFEALLDKAKRFLDDGYHEIVVTGCNLSLYADSGRRLPELLDALAALDPGSRIRLGSLEPGACARETIAAMAARENLCRYLHVSVQSGSDRMLQTMGRPYSSEEVNGLFDEARRLMPDIGLGCDLIAGFPGETVFDHMASRGLLQRYRIPHAHVFPFSKRPGTPAAAIMPQIARDLASKRAHELSDISEKNRKAFARRFVGKTVEVVVEGHRHLKGWTGEYLWLENFEKTQSDIRTSPRRQLMKFVVRKIEGGKLLGARV